MTETRELTCIGCPRGCSLNVVLEDGAVVSLVGNSCPIGDSYGRKEVTDPRRTVTSTVAVIGGEYRVVPVKTASDIPKHLIMDCMAEIARTQVTAPVHIGDVVIKNVLGTGTDVVATKNINSL